MLHAYISAADRRIINYLEDDTCRAGMTLQEGDWATLEKIMTHLEGLLRENVTTPELRRRFFGQKQQEDESLTHFAVALQNIWKCLKKRDACDCANITDLDHLLRDQFIVGLKAGPVRRALQERIRAQPTISLHDVVVVA